MVAWCCGLIQKSKLIPASSSSQINFKIKCLPASWLNKVPLTQILCFSSSCLTDTFWRRLHVTRSCSPSSKGEINDNILIILFYREFLEDCILANWRHGEMDAHWAPVLERCQVCSEAASFNFYRRFCLQIPQSIVLFLHCDCTHSPWFLE